MAKFLKSKESKPSDPLEKAESEVNITPESADKTEESTDSKREALDADRSLPNENPAGARDLTDEELEKLNESFKKGLETVKNHPWNGKED